MTSLPVGHFDNRIKKYEHALSFKGKREGKKALFSCLFSFPDLGRRRIKRDSLSVDE